MTLKEYLENKPDNFKFELWYRDLTLGYHNTFTKKDFLNDTKILRLFNPLDNMIVILCTILDREIPVVDVKEITNYEDFFIVEVNE